MSRGHGQGLPSTPQYSSLVPKDHREPGFSLDLYLEGTLGRLARGRWSCRHGRRQLPGALESVVALAWALSLCCRNENAGTGPGISPGWLAIHRSPRHHHCVVPGSLPIVSYASGLTPLDPVPSSDGSEVATQATSASWCSYDRLRSTARWACSLLVLGHRWAVLSAEQGPSTTATGLLSSGSPSRRLPCVLGPLVLVLFAHWSAVSPWFAILPFLPSVTPATTIFA